MLTSSTPVLEAEPGKLDMKTQTWYSIYQITHWFTLHTGNYGVYINFRVDSTSSMPFKKCSEIDNFYQVKTQQSS